MPPLAADECVMGKFLLPLFVANYLNNKYEAAILPLQPVNDTVAAPVNAANVLINVFSIIIKPPNLSSVSLFDTIFIQQFVN